MAIRTLLLDGDGVCQHAPFGWTAGVLRRTGDWGTAAAWLVPSVLVFVAALVALASGTWRRRALRSRLKKGLS